MCNFLQAQGQVLHGSLQRESADWLPSAVSPCYCGARAASPRKIWWQHLALSRRVSWFPSRRLVASRWLSLDSQAEHHLFRDCCDANKGGHWGSAVGITRGVEAEMLRSWYSLMRTSSTDSLLLFDVVMEDPAWCPTHQRLTTRQCPFVRCLTMRKFKFFLIHPSLCIVLARYFQTKFPVLKQRILFCLIYKLNILNIS